MKLKIVFMIFVLVVEFITNTEKNVILMNYVRDTQFLNGIKI